MLANKIHDAPPAIALLDVANGGPSHLGTPEPTAQKNRQDSGT
jgi:hypothetical protein